MPSPDDLHWVKSTANELNNLLQVITESSQFLQRFTGGNAEAARYHDMMRSALERAAQVSRAMLERVGQQQAAERTSSISPFPGPGSFTTTPAPAHTRAGTFG